MMTTKRYAQYPMGHNLDEQTREIAALRDASEEA